MGKFVYLLGLILGNFLYQLLFVIDPSYEIAIERSIFQLVAIAGFFVVSKLELKNEFNR